MPFEKAWTTAYIYSMKKFGLLFILLFTTTVFVQAQDKRAAYHDNGNKKWEGHILDGKKMGEWTYYYDNGQIQKEGIYREGKPYGEWTAYWRNGQIKSKGKYIVHNGNPVKHGEWVYYHKNGAEQGKGEFRAGKQVGTWYEYNTLGIEVGKKQY
jgi:antitoxin component YwqK of YwqJK toxin-antitoxin module